MMWNVDGTIYEHNQQKFMIYSLCVLCRERTDLTTGSELAPIYVDRRSVQSNERSVTDLAVIHPINTIQCNRSI